MRLNHGLIQLILTYVHVLCVEYPLMKASLNIFVLCPHFCMGVFHLQNLLNDITKIIICYEMLSDAISNLCSGAYLERFLS